MRLKIYFIWLIAFSFVGYLPLQAQDPFFVHFFNNRTLYNPALTGVRGALSFDLKYKQQWQSQTITPFRTFSASVEESVPCGLFDFGLHFLADEEGDGLLRTTQAGFSFAATVAGKGNKTAHNLRIGGGFYWAQKQVDFDRLLFSDQLDPKLGSVDAQGNINPTDFIPPNDGKSRWFFAPSIGIVYRYANQDKKQTLLNSFMAGFAYHNAFSIGNNSFTGHEESLLYIGTKIPERISFFIEPELVPFQNSRTYYAITPLFLFQNQSNLMYFETGAKIRIKRIVALGAYYHFSRPSDQGVNSNWLNFTLDFGTLITGSRYDNRIDLGFAYAPNFTGLRNIVGPIMEFTFSYHIGKSNICRWQGKSDEVPYQKGPKCWVNGRGKIYDNIWYQ